MWKDAKIFLEWFSIEIKKDLLSLFKTTASSGTYASFIKSLVKSIRNVFFKPRNQVYWSFLLFVIALAIGNNISKIMFFSLFIILYFRKLWIGGEPMEFYRKKYYS